MRSLLVSMILGTLVILAAPRSECWAQSLNGSGSTFVAPMMEKWARDYAKAKEVKINYTQVGSGAGIRQLGEKDTDFGCSDAPLTDDQMRKFKEAGGDVVHIPLV